MPRWLARRLPRIALEPAQVTATRAFATAAAFAAALLDAGCELDEDAGTIQSEERTVATASGRVGALTATLGGVGKLQLVELTAKQAKVRISGIGNATVNVTEDLDAVVTGVGDIEYQGDPIVRSDVCGLGDVHPGRQ